MSNQAAYGECGPSRSTVRRAWLWTGSAAMWLGTMSTTRPRPWARAVRERERSPASPPSSARTRVGSVTSYPCVEPGTASRTGERWRWETPSAARAGTSASAAAKGWPGWSWIRYVAVGGAGGTGEAGVMDEYVPAGRPLLSSRGAPG